MPHTDEKGMRINNFLPLLAAVIILGPLARMSPSVFLAR